MSEPIKDFAEFCKVAGLQQPSSYQMRVVEQLQNGDFRVRWSRPHGMTVLNRYLAQFKNGKPKHQIDTIIFDEYLPEDEL